MNGIETVFANNLYPNVDIQYSIDDNNSEKISILLSKKTFSIIDIIGTYDTSTSSNIPYFRTFDDSKTLGFSEPSFYFINELGLLDHEKVDNNDYQFISSVILVVDKTDLGNYDYIDIR